MIVRYSRLGAATVSIGGDTLIRSVRSAKEPAPDDTGGRPQPRLGGDGRARGHGRSVHLANGLPSFTLVGLPDTEVKKARERVRAALQDCRFEFPSRRITVNLAPAELPKASGRFDLPIALGILAASGQLGPRAFDRYEFAGELSLSGELRPVRGALAMADAVARSGSSQGRRGFVLPQESADEAALVGEVPIYGARDLLRVVAHLAADGGDERAQRLERHRPTGRSTAPFYPDLDEVKGQQAAKRALEIAAAGGHSLLMVGPPGTGKSMLAQRLPGILPPMTDEEALASAAVLSLSGQFRPEGWATRGFRAAHHSASGAALVGGGSVPKPGEISLAHYGVLCLDELPEFDRHVLEVLREPLQSGRITISGAARQVRLSGPRPVHRGDEPLPVRRPRPSHPRLQLHTGGNRPVPGSHQRPTARPHRHAGGGAVADRQRVARPPVRRSFGAGGTARVPGPGAGARSTQGCANAALAGADIDRMCRPEGAVRQLLHAAASRLGWSARADHRDPKPARTIADLEGAGALAPAHVAEAIQYRRSIRDS